MESGMTVLAWILIAFMMGIIVVTLIKDPPIKAFKEALENIDPDDEEEW